MELEEPTCEIDPKKVSFLRGVVFGGGITTILLASRVSVESTSPMAMILSSTARSLTIPSFLLARMITVSEVRRIRRFPRKLVRVMLESVISRIWPT